MSEQSEQKSDAVVSDATDRIEAHQQQLHSETARIAWRELQRFFAQGKVLHLRSDLDLVRVAAHFACDDAHHVQALIGAQQLAPVTDDQARRWFDADASVWSVVVAPFVLVQEEQDTDQIRTERT